ncbi:MAG: hypothetical protein KDA84_00840, partial [Planctomycetaceae bacterium]|nr:hypothetical protein [Planctomycetaceae bacterium]
NGKFATEVAQEVAKLVSDFTALAKVERVKLIQAVERGDYSQLTPLGKKALEADNVNIDQLQQKRGEVFRKALTPIEIQSSDEIQNQSLTQNGVRVNVLMSRTEVKNLYDALNQIVGEDIINKQIREKPSLKRLIANATVTVVGDDTTLSFRDALETITGIPAQSQLLEGADKIDELYKEGNFDKLLKELEHLTEVRNRLRDALDNRYSELSWVDGKNSSNFDIREMKIKTVYPFGERQQPKRSFQFGGVGEEYLWIDLQLEYP